MKEGQVLLFSGGMDSLMMSHQYPNAEKLYISVGSRYESKELHFLDMNYPGEVIVDNRLQLADLERDDAIIPARNLFLIAISSFYGNQIILSSVAGDRSTDKDMAFSRKMGDVLTHIYQPPHFSLTNGVSVLFPGKNKSKGQHVREYLMAGGDEFLLVDSVSCYHPTHTQCGVCKACMRKWTALEANDIHCDNIWHTHPSKADWTDAIRALMSGGWRDPIEDQYTIQTLQKHGVLLP